MFAHTLLKASNDSPLTHTATNLTKRLGVLWCLGVTGLLISLASLFLHAQQPKTPIQQSSSPATQENAANKTQDAIKKESESVVGAASQSRPPLHTPPSDQSATQTQDHRVERYSLGIQFLTLLVVGVYAYITYEQWKSTRKHTDLLRQQTELSTRAWIEAEMVSAGPVTFGDTGAQVSFVIRTTNTGHSPALNVYILLKVVNSQSPDIVGIQKELANGLASRPAEMGTSVFPGRDYLQPFQLTVEQQELEKEFTTFAKGSLLLNVIGCVDYSIGSSSDHHQTFFSYSLFSADNHGATAPIMNGVAAPAEKVKFVVGSILGRSAN
jgi:hypothetical protein